MKKFTKLAAVFAALVLTWACFVACSNGDDDSSSVQALQGLWILEDDNTDGIYIVGNTIYPALFINNINQAFYNKESGLKFSVSENKIKASGEEMPFEINGNGLIMSYKEDEDQYIATYKKITKTTIGISSKEFEQLVNSLFADQYK